MFYLEPRAQFFALLVALVEFRTKLVSLIRVAALYIRLDGWVLAGLIFDGPPAMCLSPAFFVWVYLVVYPQFHPGDRLFQFVVVTDCACTVDYHLRGHEPGNGGYNKIEPDLRLIHRKLVPLHVHDQVWLYDRPFHQHQELALGFFRPATRTENAAADIDLRAQDAVNESLD